MVLEFIKQLVATHPSKKFVLEASPVEYIEPNKVFIQKHKAFVEVDVNKVIIYIEPRPKSLLIEVDCEEESISVDYFKLKDGVLNWKEDHDYDWVEWIQKIETIKMYNEMTKAWEPLQLECVVCMGNDVQCYTPCGHVVCQGCLMRWWQQGKNTCPMCRGDLDDAFMLTGEY